MKRDMVPMVLRRASELVRSGWCQGNGARRRNRHVCDPISPAAVKWCAWGAIFRAVTEMVPESLNFEVRNRAMKVILDIVWPEDHLNGVPRYGGLPTQVMSWNDSDGMTKGQVIAALEEGAAKDEMYA